MIEPIWLLQWWLSIWEARPLWGEGWRQDRVDTTGWRLLLLLLRESKACWLGWHASGIGEWTPCGIPIQIWLWHLSEWLLLKSRRLWLEPIRHRHSRLHEARRLRSQILLHPQRREFIQALTGGGGMRDVGHPRQLWLQRL